MSGREARSYAWCTSSTSVLPCNSVKFIPNLLSVVWPLDGCLWVSQFYKSITRWSHYCLSILAVHKKMCNQMCQHRNLYRIKNIQRLRHVNLQHRHLASRSMIIAAAFFLVERRQMLIAARFIFGILMKVPNLACSFYIGYLYKSKWTLESSPMCSNALTHRLKSISQSYSRYTSLLEIQQGI